MHGVVRFWDNCGREVVESLIINFVSNKKVITFALPNKVGVVVKPESSLKV